MKASAIAPAFAVIFATAVSAQRQTVLVRGVIFDSLRGQPSTFGFIFVRVEGSNTLPWREVINVENGTRWPVIGRNLELQRGV